MNDEFLLRYRRTPRAEFADALYERISSQPEPRFAIPMLNRLTFRNVGAMLALMLFVAACMYAVVDRGWRKVGDIWVQVERTHKVLYVPLAEAFEGSEIAPSVYECLTVEEARNILRFDMRVPSWMPAGFTLRDEICGVDQISDYAFLYWEGTDKFNGISLMLANLRWYDPTMLVYKVGPASIWGPVAPGSYEEVRVNGQPAVLVRGNWDLTDVTSEIPRGRKLDPDGYLDAKWDKKLGLQLHWVDGEVIYHLYTREDVSPEDLIRMAESAR